MATRFAFVDDSGETRLAGFLVPEPGGSQPSIPQATDGTIDDSTYPSFGRVLVVPADQNVIAIAIEGDAYPRVLITSDPSDGIYLGDGTANPFSGANIWLQSGVLRVKGPSGVRLGGNGADNPINVGVLPTSDPEISGALWNNLGIVTVSA